VWQHHATDAHRLDIGSRGCAALAGGPSGQAAECKPSLNLAIGLYGLPLVLMTVLSVHVLCHLLFAA
jgi:hypothetical protein